MSKMHPNYAVNNDPALQQPAYLVTNGKPVYVSTGGFSARGSVPAGHRQGSVRALLAPYLYILPWIAYFVAIALQDTHLRLGLIIATGIAGWAWGLGTLAWIARARKAFIFWFEPVMVIVMAVQLGVSYVDNETRDIIQKYFNFITITPLALVCLLSLLVGLPVGKQPALEVVHPAYGDHAAVQSTGFATTCVLGSALIVSDVLYLVPYCTGREDHHWHALNLVFRIILPIVSVALALLLMALWPHVMGLYNMTSIFAGETGHTGPAGYATNGMGVAVNIPQVHGGTMRLHPSQRRFWHSALTRHPVAPTTPPDFMSLYVPQLIHTGNTGPLTQMMQQQQQGDPHQLAQQHTPQHGQHPYQHQTGLAYPEAAQQLLVPAAAVAQPVRLLRTRPFEYSPANNMHHAPGISGLLTMGSGKIHPMPVLSADKLAYEGVKMGPLAPYQDPPPVYDTSYAGGNAMLDPWTAHPAPFPAKSHTAGTGSQPPSPPTPDYQNAWMTAPPPGTMMTPAGDYTAQQVLPPPPQQMPGEVPLPVDAQAMATLTKLIARYCADMVYPTSEWLQAPGAPPEKTEPTSNSGVVVRVASWNLANFDYHGGVTERVRLMNVARMILLSKADIVALQEVFSERGPFALCSMLNVLSQRKNTPDITWRCAVSDKLGNNAEMSAFLWWEVSAMNANSGPENSLIRDLDQFTYLQTFPSDFIRSPFYGLFSVRHRGSKAMRPMMLVSCHLKAVKDGKAQTVDEVRRLGQLIDVALSPQEGDDAAAVEVVVLGDFNIGRGKPNSPEAAAWAEFEAGQGAALPKQWQRCLNPDVPTNVNGDEHYDEIWVPKGSPHSSVVASGVMPLPVGLEPADLLTTKSLLSDHHLVWADIQFISTGMMKEEQLREFVQRFKPPVGAAPIGPHANGMSSAGVVGGSGGGGEGEDTPGSGGRSRAASRNPSPSRTPARSRNASPARKPSPAPTRPDGTATPAANAALKTPSGGAVTSPTGATTAAKSASATTASTTPDVTKPATTPAAKPAATTTNTTITTSSSTAAKPAAKPAAISTTTPTTSTTAAAAKTTTTASATAAASTVAAKPAVATSATSPTATTSTAAKTSTATTSTTAATTATATKPAGSAPKSVVATAVVTSTPAKPAAAGATTSSSSSSTTTATAAAAAATPKTPAASAPKTLTVAATSVAATPASTAAVSAAVSSRSSSPATTKPSSTATTSTLR